jgi:NADH-quinone oxidoreductase subunit G
VVGGALPGLVRGGRPVADPAARVDTAAAWGVDSLPAEAGRDTAAIVAAAAAGDLAGLLVAGVEPDDLPDPQAALAALDTAAFVVSLEARHSAVTERADVVLPVAATAEKAGTFLDWEGRHRGFGEVISGTNAMADHRVLSALADELGLALGTGTAAAVRRELGELGEWEGPRATATAAAEPAAEPIDAAEPIEADEPPADAAEAPIDAAEPADDGAFVLATWRMLLDLGRGQDDEPHLAATARATVARVSPAAAAALGAAEGDLLEVANDRGSITLPLAITTPMADGVVWVPANSAGSRVRTALAADAGDRVRVTRAAATTDQEADA